MSDDASFMDEDATHQHSPAGAIELDDADLALATGGLMTAGCGCSGGCSHHCGSYLLPGVTVINPAL